MDFSFARRPAWLLSHLLVLALIVAMINLGLWQLRRLDERQERNDRIVDRSEQPVADFVDLAAGRLVGETDDLEWRVAAATGTYDGADQMLVVNRSLDGGSGAWVLTPLVSASGEVVVVNRGWIPFAVQQADDRSILLPPAGEVSVIGLVQSSQRRGRIGAGNPDDPELLARVDLESFSERLGYDVAPAYLQLESQSPPGGELPRLIPRPDLTNGPHLSYAIQWFIFTAIAVGGYPLVLRKVAATRRDPEPDPDFLAYADAQLR